MNQAITDVLSMSWVHRAEVVFLLAGLCSLVLAPRTERWPELSALLVLLPAASLVPAPNPDCGHLTPGLCSETAPEMETCPTYDRGAPLQVRPLEVAGSWFKQPSQHCSAEATRLVVPHFTGSPHP